MAVSTREKPSIDLLTLSVISASAYLFGTFLHEMVGHGLNCLIVGGRVTELSAFYANCDYGGISDLAIRWVAFAGPLVSLLAGLISFRIWSRISAKRVQRKFFFWLLGSHGLMTAAGYLLFSGVSGLGDFGVSRDGVLYLLSQEWLWRIIETLLGITAYAGVVTFAVRRMEDMNGGSGVDRIRHARRIALIAYLSGAVVSILVSLLNPVGIVIILTSAAAASLGGSSGLLWMMPLMNRKKETGQPLLAIPRSWAWIVGGLIFILLYALIFGPTLHP